MVTAAGTRGRLPILPGRMPIYEYRCDNGHLFEVMQKITDDPMTHCETCEAPVQRVFHPVAVHFKGSGFYNTDYGTARRKRESEKSASEGADSRDAKQADKKKDTGGSSSGSDSSSSSSSSSSSTSSSSS
jgi:putative FmdB family regulatory protein